MSLALRPVSLAEARRFVAQHHRHNEPDVGWKFGAGAEVDGVLVGVVVAGRPKGRGLQDGWTLEVTRCCTDGYRNACSFLYGAIARAAKALGYRRLYSYLLSEEDGASLLAAGWVRDAELGPREAWVYTGQERYQHDLFGNERRPPGSKTRWRKDLVA